MRFSYGGGEDSILLDLKTQRLFSWEKDQEKLKDYGAIMTYTSCSGLSGEGHLDLRRHPEIVEVGYYRTDTVGFQAWGVDVGGTTIWVPFRSHKGIDYGAATVMRRRIDNQDHVVLVPTDADEILRWLREWPATYWEMEVSRYNDRLYRMTNPWRLTVCNGVRGANAERFLSYWSEFRGYAETAIKASGEFRRSAHMQAMGLYTFSGASWEAVHGQTVYHIDAYGPLMPFFPASMISQRATSSTGGISMMRSSCCGVGAATPSRWSRSGSAGRICAVPDSQPW
jgi:hypothetical protein